MTLFTHKPLEAHCGLVVLGWIGTHSLLIVVSTGVLSTGTHQRAAESRVTREAPALQLYVEVVHVCTCVMRATLKGGVVTSSRPHPSIDP